ncbi:hypothetical protein [Homoserinimonas sp. OAct 916]|uniref:hypothetical protein n=1 Tax=Homoserinimonas sp. OAct 916 TaxID=2211450 RepID=UPI000DBE0DB6|nr:hypothetical protein [Homoserinimonas sp. OAct 916]
MKVRIAASVVLAVGVLLGTSACNLLVPQATTIQYDAGDGANVAVGEMRILNAILITDDNQNANLVVTVANNSDANQLLNIEVEGPSTSVKNAVPVNNTTLNVFGSDQAPQLTFSNVGVQAGALAPVYFQYGDAEGQQLLVPVLTSALGPYKGLEPVK